VRKRAGGKAVAARKRSLQHATILKACLNGNKNDSGNNDFIFIEVYYKNSSIRDVSK